MAVVQDATDSSTTFLDGISSDRERAVLWMKGLRDLSNLTSDQQKVVLQEFDSLGPAYLRTVFDACKEEIDFDELKILQVYYLSKHYFNK